MPAADAAMVRAWGTKTGYEGKRHRHLRAAATGLLAALAPGMDIKTEQPRHEHGRCIRPDLQVSFGMNGVLIAEVGVVEGDAVAAVLLAEHRNSGVLAGALVTHVVALPFAGHRTDAARGYVFRRVGRPVLRTPTRPEIRTAWASFAGRPMARTQNA
jgi:hypothetical protein